MRRRNGIFFKIIFLYIVVNIQSCLSLSVRRTLQVYPTRKSLSRNYSAYEFQHRTSFLSCEKAEEKNFKIVEECESDTMQSIVKSSDDKVRRRKMEISWCGRNGCVFDKLRETVVGDQNTIIFDSPATGQVAYSWQANESITHPITPKVLILVKRNDDDLLKCAADIVRELTDVGDILVMVQPEVAAKLKHYYQVDNERIQLFDQKPVPGFGGNHLPADQFQYNLIPSFDEEIDTHGNENSPDLICTLGGDGLLMHASSLFAGPCPPILCVAGGSLGFLTPFSRDEMVEAVRISLSVEVRDRMMKNNNSSFRPPISTLNNDVLGNTTADTVKFGASNQICLSMRMRLECRVINREGVVRARFNVLNEVVIDRGSSPYLAALECFCDDVHLTTVQADGIIFSTPTGSTAYSMAAGGSVVHPAVPCILVTPICPHVLSFRSMVFPDHVVLRCYVPDDARADASVAFDGKHRRELHRGDSLQVQMSAYPVPTINRSDHTSDWLASLKNSFNFNSRARQGPL